MDLKEHPFGFPKRPYLLHSVQMAVTGDFLKKMSEISPTRDTQVYLRSKGAPFRLLPGKQDKLAGLDHATAEQAPQAGPIIQHLAGQ